MSRVQKNAFTGGLKDENRRLDEEKPFVTAFIGRYFDLNGEMGKWKLYMRVLGQPPRSLRRPDERSHED